MPIYHCLILLIAANGAPIVARNLLGRYFDAPVDGGLNFIDGRPLFGASKTWRGIIVALLATAFTGGLLQTPVASALLFGALAMAGDLFSSFIKRRLNRPPSSMALGLDQIPESLLPAAVFREQFHYAWSDVTLIIGLFIVCELVLSFVLFKLHIRKRPY